MKSGNVKRSVEIGGHKTSISLEDCFWVCLQEIATSHRTTVGALLNDIDRRRQHKNLSSHIRLFVLDHYRSFVQQM